MIREPFLDHHSLNHKLNFLSSQPSFLQIENRKKHEKYEISELISPLKSIAESKLYVTIIAANYCL